MLKKRIDFYKLSDTNDPKYVFEFRVKKPSSTNT